jgi:hypothetical protein
MAYQNSSAGVALLRDMAMQPTMLPRFSGNNLITFDSAGAFVYGLNTESTEFGLRRNRVVTDGLAEELKIAAATDFSTRALAFANNRVIAGHALYDAPALDAAGTVSSPSDCVPRRSGDLLLCFGTSSFNSGRAGVLSWIPAPL